MKKIKIIVFLFLCLFGKIALSQNNDAVKIHTEDITNFWTAYDQVVNAKDTTRQITIIQTLFIDKASDGMKNFMQVRPNLTASKYVQSINKYPKFWKSVKVKTLLVNQSLEKIQDNMNIYRAIYPEFKQPEIFFSISHLSTGGTTVPGRILIGTEIAAADSTVDASELSPFLQDLFKHNQDIVYVVTHEITHTQQIGSEALDNGKADLLAQCLSEGACEFVAELIVKKQLMFPYMTYGRLNEHMLWEKFKTEMNDKSTKNWLYNTATAPGGHKDLGYFMGYVICKSYYEKATDKNYALKQIIELDYSDSQKVHNFLNDSGYADKWAK
ncbi:DUF2268 domain-containing putative Zn-dependent protease [Mucilaginibacter sp. X4EP1]|uniref:DUF2268 domain-containing putative Zn-dependent protease n=1 Tax=Mucilaginibacter sp. X4EP1 TaxID=2723092 RepID=UPI002167ED6D|nr:DUF2268 domain-containing putative Zn-dependent protease [Mucilaginibacter sp. X4EP1]MCS3815930.1 hypothetical protein [Mucilaginibacter sp. X4EP1]